MLYQTTVKVILDDAAETALANVKVSLYDRDTFSPDDLLGTGTTDAAGQVDFQYDGEDFRDLEDRLTGGFPELYAVVHAAEGHEQVVSTRDAVMENYVRREITVRVPREDAARHGLV